MITVNYRQKCKELNVLDLINTLKKRVPQELLPKKVQEEQEERSPRSSLKITLKVPKNVNKEAEEEEEEEEVEIIESDHEEKHKKRKSSKSPSKKKSKKQKTNEKKKSTTDESKKKKNEEKRKERAKEFKKYSDMSDESIREYMEKYPSRLKPRRNNGFSGWTKKTPCIECQIDLAPDWVNGRCSSCSQQTTKKTKTQKEETGNIVIRNKKK